MFTEPGVLAHRPDHQFDYAKYTTFGASGQGKLAARFSLTRDVTASRREGQEGLGELGPYDPRLADGGAVARYVRVDDGRFGGGIGRVDGDLIRVCDTDLGRAENGIEGR